MNILASRKQELFDLALSKGFKPTDFGWEEDVSESDTTFIIKYEAHGFYFSFSKKGEALFKAISYKPAGNKLEQRSAGGKYKWSQIVGRFKAWLSYLAREVTADSLYLSMSEGDAIMTVASRSADIDNESFSETEVGQIREGLDKIEELVRNYYELNGEQIDRFLELSSNLKEGARSYGRRDWLFMLIGALVSYTIQVGLPPDEAQRLLREANELAVSLFYRLLN